MAAAAHAAGVGATIRVSLGGHHAPEICGYPLEEEAEVVSLSDGRWVLTAFTVGVEQDVGPMAGCLHYAQQHLQYLSKETMVLPRQAWDKQTEHRFAFEF